MPLKLRDTLAPPAKSTHPPREEEEVSLQAAQDETKSEEEGEDATMSDEEHLTKMGTPDRRYQGQRDLPAQNVVNPNYKKPTSGEYNMDLGIHLTKDGKPDRRYEENRAVTPEEAERLQAEFILQKHGVVLPKDEDTEK